MKIGMINKKMRLVHNPESWVGVPIATLNMLVGRESWRAMGLTYRVDTTLAVNREKPTLIRTKKNVEAIRQ